MPAPGRKPKDGPKHGRTPQVHDWVEVEDIPYRGKRPSLPKTRCGVDKEGTFEVALSTKTKTWWKTVSSMPHCRLWTDADWQFALDTALVADAFYAGDTKAATELRIREKVLGTTLDARRDLRIRYVPPGETRRAIPEGTVVDLDERRRRIGGA